MTSEERFKLRLKNEYEAVALIPKNDVFDVFPAPGETIPYVRNYLVTYHIPTYINGGRTIQEETTVRISLPDSFPQGQPSTVVESGNVPFHVNWWAKGTVCNGNFWSSVRWVWEYIGFVGELLQFQPARINVKSPANREAIPFFQNNRQKFPTDSRRMPAPRKKNKLVFI